MTRTLVHVGLAAMFVIAPALCCCQARVFSDAAHAAPASPQPTQTPQPEESCCKKVRSCCHEEGEPPAPGKHAPEPAPRHDSCACNTERPDAAQTESKPTVAAAEPTGELVALPHAALVASPAHRGSSRGARPPHAGTDAKSAALFDRHVMRC